MEETLFVAGWTGRQELGLLEAIEEFGYGNWAAIGNKLGRSHEVFPASWHLPQPSPSQTLSHDLTNLDYPGKEIIHYNPLRGDFEVEPDNEAEGVLNGVPVVTVQEQEKEEQLGEEKEQEEEEEADKLVTTLQLAVVSSYIWRLKRRQYWKMIVREHGLIDIFRQQAREKMLSPAQRHVRQWMRPFMRFLSASEAEKLIQSFILEIELREKRSALLHYRQMGITSFKGAELYQRLKDRREHMKEKKKQLIREVCRNEDRLFHLILTHHQQQLGSIIDRRQQMVAAETRPSGTVPLDISLSPGVDKLSQEEKDFCSQNRLLPEVFLRCKTVMVSECKKTGKLRLMDARKICRIDVNKTRRIYDLLKRNGLVIPP